MRTIKNKKDAEKAIREALRTAIRFEIHELVANEATLGWKIFRVEGEWLAPVNANVYTTKRGVDRAYARISSKAIQAEGADAAICACKRVDLNSTTYVTGAEEDVPKK